MEQFGALKRRTTELMNDLPQPPTQAAKDSFGALKRRTTGLMENLPKPAMPAMPAMPSMPSQMPNLPNFAGLSSRLPRMPAWGPSHASNTTLKATWERIDLPPLPRSSHSINIVSGSAYIFGGEINPREPVDNEMHVITLPFSSAGADYYAIKAKAAPKSEVPQVPTVIAPSDDGEVDEEKGKGKELAEVPLGSPDQEGSDVVTGSDQINNGPGLASSKGKEITRPYFDTSSLGDVPSPRVGHVTAVIGNRIFMFGGRGGADMAALEEHGRVWVFDTKTHLWSYLDPILPASKALSPSHADKRQYYPAARSYHSAVGVDQPRDFEVRSKKGAVSWAEWASGDSDLVGTPQRPIVGNVANNSRDEDEDGFGTFIVHGGCFAEGRANDTWAFDVRSRVWQELPSAPGKPRGGTSIAVANSRLWRFGGFNGEAEEGGQLDYLDLGVDSFDHRSGEGDFMLGARGEWKSIFPEEPTASPAPAAAEPRVKVEATGEDDATAPLTTSYQPHWPGNRSVTGGMQTVTIAGPGGRQYLVLMLGERDASNAGHEAAGKFWDDIWAYELPPKPTTASWVTGTVFGRGRSGSKSQAGTVEGKWFRVETEAYDDDDDAAGAGPGPRGWLATAHMGELDERGVVLWGGLDATNRRLGDGWILRMSPEKREP